VTDDDELEPIALAPPDATPWSPWSALPPAGSEPPRRRTAAIVASVLALMLLGGGAGFAIAYNTGSSSSPTTRSAPSIHNVTLGRIVLQQRDVPTGVAVGEIANGDQLSEPTLDLCNAKFASEKLRAARLQIASLNAQGTGTLSTEAVLYRNAHATAQAFVEIRDAAAKCPARPVTSPVGEPTVTTKFHAPPDKAWPRTPGIDRLAYDLTATNQNGRAFHSVVVYLRRGRLFLGVYFGQPAGAQSPVGGKTSIPAIVQLFESRVAATPGASISD
jgi:hypothetical protein